MITIYDLERLVSVEIVDKRIDDDFKWFEAEKKTFWKKGRPAGIYLIQFGYNLEFYTAEGLRSGELHDVKYLVEDNIVYYRPYIRLSFVDGSKRVITYESYDEAKSAGEQYARKVFKVPVIFK